MVTTKNDAPKTTSAIASTTASELRDPNDRSKGAVVATDRGIDNVQSEGKSAVFLITSRFVFIPDGKFHPFLIGGVGLHHTKLKVINTFQDVLDSNSPIESLTERNISNTTERSTTNFAAMAGLGADYSLTKNLYLGLEGRWQYLKNAIDSRILNQNNWIDPTVRDYPDDTRKSITTINVLAQIGYKLK